MSALAVQATLPAHSRVSRIHRVAELIVRYRHCTDDKGRHRIRDMESDRPNAMLPAIYADEDMARAGARLQAACDIHELFDEREGR